MRELLVSDFTDAEHNVNVLYSGINMYEANNIRNHNEQHIDASTHRHDDNVTLITASTRRHNYGIPLITASQYLYEAIDIFRFTNRVSDKTAFFTDNYYRGLDW